jgi:FMN phosphatase YigB (HAD superfamily)
MNISSAGAHRRVLLLDFDGVVFRNRRSHSIVGERIVEYVRTRAGLSTYWEAKQINKIAYEKYGHTLRGLADMRPDLELSIEDFNDFVYDRGVVSAARMSICYDRDERPPADAGAFLRYCGSIDVTPYIYTNAPLSWVAMGFGMYGIDFPEERILSPDSIAMVPGRPVLKPDLASFARAGSRALDECGGSADILFVDDGAANCFMSEHYMGWRTFRFEDGHALSYDVAKWMGV